MVPYEVFEILWYILTSRILEFEELEKQKMTFQKAKISKSQQLNKELQMRKTIIVVRNYQYILEFPSEIPPNSHPQSVKFKPSPMGKYSPNPVVV